MAENKPEITIEDAKKQADKIIADAKAKAEKIKAAAEKSGQTIGALSAAVSSVDRKKAQEEYANSLTTIRLFADNDKYKDDVFVCVNGETCQIRRGEDVIIKRKFADAILASQNQERYAVAYIKDMLNELDANKKELN